MTGWAWGGMTIAAVVVLAILGLVVWAIARRPADAPSAREQLDARLASGAIDTEEYRKRLDAITQA